MDAHSISESSNFNVINQNYIWWAENLINKPLCDLHASNVNLRCTQCWFPDYVILPPQLGHDCHLLLVWNVLVDYSSRRTLKNFASFEFVSWFERRVVLAALENLNHLTIETRIAQTLCGIYFIAWFCRLLGYFLI